MKWKFYSINPVEFKNLLSFNWIYDFRLDELIVLNLTTISILDSIQLFESNWTCTIFLIEIIFQIQFHKKKVRLVKESGLTKQLPLVLVVRLTLRVRLALKFSFSQKLCMGKVCFFNCFYQFIFFSFICSIYSFYFFIHFLFISHFSCEEVHFQCEENELMNYYFYQISAATFTIKILSIFQHLFFIVQFFYSWFFFLLWNHFF